MTALCAVAAVILRTALAANRFVLLQFKAPTHRMLLCMLLLCCCDQSAGFGCQPKTPSNTTGAISDVIPFDKNGYGSFPGE